MSLKKLSALCAATILAGGAGVAAAADLRTILSYPFVPELVASRTGEAIAWVEVRAGVRTVFTASGPDFAPHVAARDARDDGQEVTGLTFSPDGKTLLYVRGGDHDGYLPTEGGPPDPAADPTAPKVEIFRARPGGAAERLADGDHPAISATGVLAYVKDGEVWTAPLEGGGKAERLLYDRGKVRSLAWSPDGARLAYVSDRGDHSFIGVWSGPGRPVTYLAPSTGLDGDPVWSPDGTRIAFTRQPGRGGAAEPLLERRPRPWSILVADAATGAGRVVFASPNTLDGSYPGVPDGPDLLWAAGDRLVFRAELDGWPHLWTTPASGGAAPRLLTPGAFMVEHVVASPDGSTIAYSANAGGAPGDIDRRHVFTVRVAAGAPAAVTPGEGIETRPAFAGGGLAFVSATARRPATVAFRAAAGGPARLLDPSAVAAYPAAELVTPKSVTFRAADGLEVHGQLFEGPGGGARRPAVIFVHGGPPRQMLTGWHYMDYYANAYAVNQYLATHGFVVLSVNYRLGIGYGRAYQETPNSGAAGDVQAGARFLQGLPGVDPGRIGIWGGSYGGYLTAMALARDSDVFKAGVDLHGVHDWSQHITNLRKPPTDRYEQGDWLEGMKVAFASSPVASVSTWRSPVLLIQGDDDRNVRFHQTVDLARRLDAQGVRYEELVLPNEIHGFLRAESWERADGATVEFLTRELKAAGGRAGGGEGQ